MTNLVFLPQANLLAISCGNKLFLLDPLSLEEVALIPLKDIKSINLFELHNLIIFY